MCYSTLSRKNVCILNIIVCQSVERLGVIVVFVVIVIIVVIIIVCVVVIVVAVIL